MRIGDVEYTRHVGIDQASGGTTQGVAVQFAVGIKVRALLVRASTTLRNLVAITNDAGAWFENGDAVAAGLSTGAMLADSRTITLAFQRQTLVTSGFPTLQYPIEVKFWKILMPTVTIHSNLATAGDDMEVILHYRFAELTDDEIIEIAAQRAQS